MGDLSDGNLASSRNAGDISNPREAALQGLEKMRTLVRAGLTQGVLPPLPRPNLDLLVSAGFSGTDQADNRTRRCKQAPRLLKVAYSASSMWTANAATVSPSADTQDRTPSPDSAANLSTMLHRSLEHPDTTASLQAIFGDDRAFCRACRPCRCIRTLRMRARRTMSGCAPSHGEPGVELFVYGRDAGRKHFGTGIPARQTTARRREHCTRPWAGAADRTVIARQSRRGHQRGSLPQRRGMRRCAADTLFFHEAAFEEYGSDAGPSLRICGGRIV
jgi:succinylarginine dihydrolase